MVNVVELVFFNDDATGEWGVTHAKTYENDTPFNAFWNGIGIFHDVWEHFFERNHKYFLWDSAMNIGGEMAASGAMWYYYDELGVGNRQTTMYDSPGNNMRKSTQDLIEEAIRYGYCNYGYTLECSVPKQRPVDNPELEWQIEKFYKEVKNMEIETSYESERECGREYKESVTFRKIADLHRYGYRMAKRLVPNEGDNWRTLKDFINFWSKFCRSFPAEELKMFARGITFEVYRHRYEISWKAILRTHDEYEDIEIDDDFEDKFQKIYEEV